MKISAHLLTAPQAMLLVACAFSLSACGGGSTSSSTDSATSTLPVATNPSPAASSPTPTASAPSSSLTVSAEATCAQPDFVASVMKAVNDARAQARSCGAKSFQATTPLAWNDKLFNAAAGHSSEMAQKNYFNHNSADGTTFDKRISAAGYNIGYGGENIAAGQRDVSTVINGWLNSPGHCENMMSVNYKDIGVACVKGPAGASNAGTPYWTMDLASPN